MFNEYDALIQERQAVTRYFFYLQAEFFADSFEYLCLRLG